VNQVCTIKNQPIALQSVVEEMYKT